MAVSQARVYSGPCPAAGPVPLSVCAVVVVVVPAGVAVVAVVIATTCCCSRDACGGVAAGGGRDFGFRTGVDALVAAGFAVAVAVVNVGCC